MALHVTVTDTKDGDKTYRTIEFSGSVRCTRNAVGFKPDYGYNTVDAAVYKDGTRRPLSPVAWKNGETVPKDWANANPKLPDGAAELLGRQIGERIGEIAMATSVATAPVAGMPTIERALDARGAIFDLDAQRAYAAVKDIPGMPAAALAALDPTGKAKTAERATILATYRTQLVNERTKTANTAPTRAAS